MTKVNVFAEIAKAFCTGKRLIKSGLIYFGKLGKWVIGLLGIGHFGLSLDDRVERQESIMLCRCVDVLRY